MLEEYSEVYTPFKETYDEIEDRFIENIFEKLDVNDEEGGTKEWLMKKILLVAPLTAENTKVMNRLGKRASKQLEDIYSEVGYGEVEKDENIYTVAFDEGKTRVTTKPVNYKKDFDLKNILNLTNIKGQERLNLTNTTAVERASIDFLDIINRSYLEVSSGLYDYKTSIRRAVSDLASRNINVQTYKVNPNKTIKYPIDSAVRREVLTSSSNLAREMQDIRADKWKSDLIEVSSHSGARLKCRDYQGKIYSRSGESKKYTYINDTSYGDPGGLFGINCGHQKYPFFEGLNEKTYQPTKSKKENDKKYKESQQQRYLESEIRKTKKRLIAYDADNDIEAYQKWSYKLYEKQNNLNRFMKKTGREQTPRTDTYGFDNSLKNKSRYYAKKETNEREEKK